MYLHTVLLRFSASLSLQFLKTYQKGWGGRGGLLIYIMPLQARQGFYASMSRRVMVVGTEALGANLGEPATGSDLGGRCKYNEVTEKNHAIQAKFPQTT